MDGRMERRERRESKTAHLGSATGLTTGKPPSLAWPRIQIAENYAGSVFRSTKICCADKKLFTR